VKADFIDKGLESVKRNAQKGGEMHKSVDHTAIARAMKAACVCVCVCVCVGVWVCVWVCVCVWGGGGGGV
jgi:t-SNARE complex subunit (syntaxin)